MGLVGKKVDTISWCKVRVQTLLRPTRWADGSPGLQEEISKLNKSINEKRQMLATAEKMPKPLGSAFIQCNLQMGAHVLAQCVSYHEVRVRPLPMRYRADSAHSRS